MAHTFEPSIWLKKRQSLFLQTVFSAIGRTWIQFNFHTTLQDLVPLHSKFSFLKYSYYSTTTFWFLNCKSFVGMRLVSDIDQIKKKFWLITISLSDIPKNMASKGPLIIQGTFKYMCIYRSPVVFCTLCSHTRYKFVFSKTYKYINWQYE